MQSTGSCWRLAKILFWKSSKQLSSFHRSISVSTIMKGKIPDRWEEYEPVGKVIAGTRFIAFKVPLNPMLSHSLPADVKRFLPEDLPAFIREQDRELGIVIDLTNTMRYYRPEDILKQEIAHKKIFTEGHIVPSRDVQNEFFKAVDDFLSSNKDNDRVIGVHCTHGLNRTGYLVCRYMIDRMNFKADDAIRAFNEARGHEMERQNYLSDLRGEATSSPNKGGRMERKRPTPAPECLGDSAEGRRSKSKQRCTAQNQGKSQMDNSFKGRSGPNDHRPPHGHTWPNSQYRGNGGHQRRDYHNDDYRQSYQQYPQSYGQSFSYHNQYDFAGQPQGYDRQGYQNYYASEGSWRNQRDYDQDGFDFASNHTPFSGASFQSRGGRAQGWGRNDSRPQYSRNREARGKARYSDPHDQRSDCKQWRGNKDQS